MLMGGSFPVLSDDLTISMFRQNNNVWGKKHVDFLTLASISMSCSTACSKVRFTQPASRRPLVAV